MSGGYAIQRSTEGNDFAVSSYPLANKGGRPIGWRVIATRTLRVEGYVPARNFVASFYVTRADRHNHEVFWEGDGTQRKKYIPTTQPGGDVAKWPITVQVYAICARR